MIAKKLSAKTKGPIIKNEVGTKKKSKVVIKTPTTSGGIKNSKGKK